ncbi:MAG: transglutaminase domain-containing protein [Bacteroidales bacterium]|nr:transglutaminase domain-containing protein [Bacteroidales bacterium]
MTYELIARNPKIRYTMKKLSLLLFIFILSISGCKVSLLEHNETINKIADLIADGNLSRAKAIADSLIYISKNETTKWKADSLSQISSRILLSFSLTERDIDSILKETGLNFTPSDIEKFENLGWLEYRMIDNEKKYFNRAVSNLILLKNFNENRKARDSALANDSRLLLRKNNILEIIKKSSESSTPAGSVNVEILYTITVKPDIVPPGETIRCWLPFPKENHERQRDVFLLGISNEENFLLAPDSMVHRTIYMEEKARAGEPSIFRVAYSYVTSGQYFDPEKLKISSYNKNSEIYKIFTEEQPPYICFTDDVRHLADSLAANETNPYNIVKKFYYWINNNIPWTYALEYSIIPNIPEYTLKNRRGDCGMQTFLLMSMLRYKGIPVRWQSGWTIQPGAENLHDWCEVYYEGTGWVPVDVSYGLQFSPDIKVREFYLTGIDSYRMIVNDGVSGNLFPPKNFLRSDPFDFQRGEVEWEGGNLFYDKWNYDIKINYR